MGAFTVCSPLADRLKLIILKRHWEKGLGLPLLEPTNVLMRFRGTQMKRDCGVLSRRVTDALLPFAVVASRNTAFGRSY